MIVNRTVPLRTGPSSGYASLGDVLIDTRVIVLGTNTNGQWTRIQDGDRIGWISTIRLSEIVEDAPVQTLMVTQTVPLRTGPSSTYETLGDVLIGTTVIVLGTNTSGQWTRIQDGERTGWISTNRLSEIESDAPVQLGIMLRTVPMRANSSSASDSLGDVEVGTEVIILGTNTNGQWTRIQYGDLIGWVNSTRVGPLDARINQSSLNKVSR